MKDPSICGFLIANVLARDKVLYDGHAVAAVAATSAHIAEEALNLVDVDYEILEPVLEVRRAMENDAPLLHDDLTMKSLGEETGPGQQHRKPLPTQTGRHRKGI